MREVKLTEEQIHYIEDYINDEIESAKARISCSDKKIDRDRAKSELEFFEEFMKALN